MATQPIAPGRPGVKPPVAGRPPVTRPPGVRPPARPPAYRPPVGYPPRPWYPGHPGHPGYRPGHWWAWATAGAVTGWVAYHWTNPIYYRYGSGGNVYYENNSVYIDGQQYASAEQYYNEAEEIASAVPKMNDEQAEQMEWMPLGVFALTAEGVNASSMYLQLAVSKEGVIAGTFYNESTGATHPVEGTVDEKTQRAAWMAADGSNPNLVMETGLYNLTQDTAEVLVHFGPEQTQTALLVRLDETERPAEEAAPTSQGGVNLNLPGVSVQVGQGGVQVQTPGVNVDTGAGGTHVSAPVGVRVDTGGAGTRVVAPGVIVQ